MFQTTRLLSSSLRLPEFTAEDIRLKLHDVVFRLCPVMLLVSSGISGLSAAPVIAGLANAGSNILVNSPLAQGSIFIIYGTGLGPANIAFAPTAFQTTTLNGTSVTVTVGTTTVNALMYYTSDGQVAALLPSSTPTGTGAFTVTYNGQQLHIRHVANHYYLPVLYASDPVDYIRHIIRHESEVRFLNQLNNYLAQPGNAFARYDWWLFSKLDENLDSVHIPYYDPQANRVRQFKPDFIFWFKEGNDYRILFVDPKGMQNIGWEHKIAGYRTLFEEAGAVQTFPYDGLSVQVRCALYTADANRSPDEYRRYWFDRPEQLAV